MRSLRWVGFLSSLLFVGGLMAPLPSEADNTSVKFQVDSGNTVTLLDVAAGAASTCTAGTFAGYTRCYNLTNIGVLSTGNSSRAWSLGNYDPAPPGGTDPPPRLLLTDQNSSGMDNITITTLQFNPNPNDYGSTTSNTGNGISGNSLQYGEAHELKLVITNTFGIVPNDKTVGNTKKYLFALRASGIFKGGPAGATGSGDGVTFTGDGRFGSTSTLTPLKSPFPANDSQGALPACDSSNSKVNSGRTPSTDVNYCTLRRTFGTTGSLTSSYSNVTPVPPLEQVTITGSPYPSYVCDNGTNCTPTVTLRLNAKVKGPDIWVLTSSGDAAGGTKRRCSRNDDDDDDRAALNTDDDDDDVKCLSTKKRIKRYFRQQLRRDLANPEFANAESTPACGGEGNECPPDGTGTIKIIKTTSPGTEGLTFGFEGTGEGITNFDIVTNEDLCGEGCWGGTEEFSGLLTGEAGGSREIRETSVPEGWNLQDANCDGEEGQVTSLYEDGEGPIIGVRVNNVNDNQTLTCTFHNEGPSS